MLRSSNFLITKIMQSTLLLLLSFLQRLLCQIWAGLNTYLHSISVLSIEEHILSNKTWEGFDAYSVVYTSMFLFLERRKYNEYSFTSSRNWWGEEWEYVLTLICKFLVSNRKRNQSRISLFGRMFWHSSCYALFLILIVQIFQ